MAKNKPNPTNQLWMVVVQAVEVLTAPELRRLNLELESINDANQEANKATNYMGFVYAGTVYVPEKFRKVAGRNYVGSGISWPQLHPSLWDRAEALSADYARSKDRLTQVRQYIGVVMAAPELDKHGQRNCIPDYLAIHMGEYGNIPRTEELNSFISHYPRLEKHYNSVKETMAVLAAGQLIH